MALFLNEIIRLILWRNRVGKNESKKPPYLIYCYISAEANMMNFITGGRETTSSYTNTLG